MFFCRMYFNQGFNQVNFCCQGNWCKAIMFLFCISQKITFQYYNYYKSTIMCFCLDFLLIKIDFLSALCLLSHVGYHCSCWLSHHCFKTLQSSKTNAIYGDYDYNYVLYLWANSMTTFIPQLCTRWWNFNVRFSKKQSDYTVTNPLQSLSVN